jgi:hypothetical protein
MVARKRQSRSEVDEKELGWEHPRLTAIGRVERVGSVEG